MTKDEILQKMKEYMELKDWQGVKDCLDLFHAVERWDASEAVRAAGIGEPA